MIKCECACGDPACRIKITPDTIGPSSPSSYELRFQGKDGKDMLIYLDANSITSLIGELEDMLQRMIQDA